MSLAEHADRLEARLRNIKDDREQAMKHAIAVGEFVGGVAASSGYRAWLNKNNKPMPKLAGLDADTAVGAVLVVAGFAEVLPASYADHALNFGAGLVSGAIGNKIAGMVNPSQATKGEPYQLGAGNANVSAHRGRQILDLVNARGRAA